MVCQIVSQRSFQQLVQQDVCPAHCAESVNTGSGQYNITMAEDLLRTTQMLLKHKKAVTCIPNENCYHYYLGHSGASTTNYSNKTFASEKEVISILDKIIPDKYANQHNACWGLLLLAGLCAEGVSIEERQQTVSRNQHCTSLSNPCISFAKRQLLPLAYISMPMARACAMLLLKLRNNLRNSK